MTIHRSRAGRLPGRDGAWAGAAGLFLASFALFASTARAAGPPAAPASPASAADAPRWIALPRIEGRLQPAQLGLVINDDDPYSVAVGTDYIAQRGLRPSQVLHVHLAVKPVLTEGELKPLREQIGAHFGPDIQALALAWRMPWAVACNSITSAVTLGFQPALCKNSCGAGTTSPYFGQASAAPYTRLGLRPSMLLAASTPALAHELIARGVASDGRLGRRFGPTVVAALVKTGDSARNVRARLYPPAGRLKAFGVDVRVDATLAPAGDDPLIAYQIGSARVAAPDLLHWAPGAVADHLTSFGGVLDGSSGQMPATDWIDAGATASYGTVSEPCNHLQKFPHPQLLLGFLLQGSTVIEAYWKSVAWPGQGVFIGEPLAAPFIAAAAPPARPPPPPATAAPQPTPQQAAPPRAPGAAAPGSAAASAQAD